MVGLKIALAFRKIKATFASFVKNYRPQVKFHVGGTEIFVTASNEDEPEMTKCL